MNRLLLCMLYEATLFLLVVVPSPQIPTSCKPSVLQNEDNRYTIFLPPLFDFEIALNFPYLFENTKILVLENIVNIV